MCEGSKGRMAFDIEFTDLARDELKVMRRYDQQRILDEVETQLMYEPNVETRNRKPLINASAPFEHVPPLWELRIGEFRAYYDVREADSKVHVRSVRHKKPHQTTEEVLL
jgi:mRNA-degrading endonuclease RelE of RelBE toxin-antitoxin system